MVNCTHHQHPTVQYASPEQVKEGGKITLKCDIWAYGCILLELATGIAPYGSHSTYAQVFGELNKGMNPLEYAIKNFP